jgi:hypothetical protein
MKGNTMSNPNPQHVPTDGLNVAAYVQVTGTNISNHNGGGLTVATEASYPGTVAAPALGQGFGAVASTNHPVAQYFLPLSLSSKTIFGVALHNTCQLTTVLKDVANSTYTGAVNTPVYKSYNNPSAGTPSWFRPSVFADATSTSPAYNTDVASVSGSGLITAIATGQAVIEVQFPTFDDVMTPEQDHDTSDPTMMIYAQVLVQVIP